MDGALLDLPMGIHMWVAIAAAIVAMVSYSVERVQIELTSLILIAFLMLWFGLFPAGPPGDRAIGVADILGGFANPSLIAVLALIVMGQGLVRTGALTVLTRMVIRLAKHHRHLSLAGTLGSVLGLSAFMNNTPIVVMFISVVQALANRLSISVSSLMMPLSFVAVLGGMVTLIGSSTNLLVSSALIELGERPLKMFDLTAVGLPMALIGSLYAVLILPRILPDRGAMAQTINPGGKHFVAEIDIHAGSPLIGQQSVAGHFQELSDATIRLIQRGGITHLPPFEDVVLEQGDVLILAATRPALERLLAKHAGHQLSVPNEEVSSAARPSSDHALAEVMISPTSALIDQTVAAANVLRADGCRVLGIQRRGRMTRQRILDMRLQAGDVLLVVGERGNIERLANRRDVVLLAWATTDVPRTGRTLIALSIFVLAVGSAIAGLMPLVAAAVVGAVLMVVTDCLSLRQALQSIDRQILLLVAASLALSTVLERSGAAALIVQSVLEPMVGGNATLAAIVLFLITSAATHVLSNNACAIIFTPIALNLAWALNADPIAFALTVVFAANCSFATPIGYQTHLLVMGPGHYRFRDFLRGGLPLLCLMWLTFIAIGPRLLGLM